MAYYGGFGRSDQFERHLQHLPEPGTEATMPEKMRFENKDGLKIFLETYLNHLQSHRETFFEELQYYSDMDSNRRDGFFHGSSINPWETSSDSLGVSIHSGRSSLNSLRIGGNFWRGGGSFCSSAPKPGVVQCYQHLNKLLPASMPCDLSELRNLYIIPSDIRDICINITKRYYTRGLLDSQIAIDTMLFLNIDHHARRETTEKLFDMIFKDPGMVDNWLCRNALHLAVALMDDTNALRCIPNKVVQRYINGVDAHGCTPLHIAYLHGNINAINFLKSHGASGEVEDSFGFSPENLSTRVGVICREEDKRLVSSPNFCPGQHTDDRETDSDEHPDVTYQRLYLEVMEKPAVSKSLVKVVVMDPHEVEAMSGEMTEIFKCLMQLTEYNKYLDKIAMGGSVREKLKVGRPDEFDVLIQMSDEMQIDVGDTIEGDIIDRLAKSVGHINWKKFNLRPTRTRSPWTFIWEGAGARKGMEVSVDVVPLFLSKATIPIDESLNSYYLPFRKSLSCEPSKEYNQAVRLKWKKNEYATKVRDTYFETTHRFYEWDILDSLKPGMRIGVLLVKSLLQACYWSNGGDHSKEVSVPVTSYIAKTTLFFLLSGRSVEVSVDGTTNKYFCTWDEQLDLPQLILKKDESNKPQDKFPKWPSESEQLPKEYNEKSQLEAEAKGGNIQNEVNWIDENTYHLHLEEGRKWACKILIFISKMVEMGKGPENFWDGSDIKKTENLEEVFVICSICLERLQKDQFY